MSEEGDRVAIDFRIKPPKVQSVTTAWQAWWEGYDSWDGAERYDDLDLAQRYAAVDYVEDEYSWNPESGAAEDAPEIELIWKYQNSRWVLFVDDPDEGLQETDVYLHQLRVFSTKER